MPLLSQIHKGRRLAYAQKYMKMDFQQVLFTSEASATLNGRDGWAKIWTPNGIPTPWKLRRRGGIMICVLSGNHWR